MWVLVISLILLGIVALTAGAIRNQRLLKKTDKEESTHIQEDDSSNIVCCGLHEVCEHNKPAKAFTTTIEYYDDEELDIFIGREANTYTKEETDIFCDVLYTTPENEVKDWVHSLQLRGIELPNELKSEVLLIIGDRKIKQ